MIRRKRLLAFLLCVLVMLAGTAFAQDAPDVDVKPEDLAEPPIVAEPAPVPTPPPTPPAADAPRLRLSVLAGGLMSMSSSADEEAAPLLQLSVEAPLAAYARPPRLIVGALLGALPGETISVERVETVRSLELRAGIAWQPWTSLYFSFAAWGGFATKIESDPEPLERTARFGCGAVTFDDRGGNALELGGCADQRLDGTYQPTAVVSGSVRLWKGSENVSARLVARGILGFDTGGDGLAPNDVVQIGLVIAR